MASSAEAKRYSQILIDPRVQNRESPDDTRPERNTEFLAAALEYLPTPMLELLRQREYHVAILQPGERITDYEPQLAARLANEGITSPEQIDGALAGLAALHTSDTLTNHIYMVVPVEGVFVHESAHALDMCLGAFAISDDGTLRFFENSQFDSMIGAAYDRGAELLNEYSRVNPIEAFAEWYRCALGAPNPDFDGDRLDVRADALERAPVMTRYVDAMLRSMELVLEKDPLAFTRGSQTSLDMEVVTRSKVALMLDVAPDDVNMDRLYEMRRDFLAAQVIEAIGIEIIEPPKGPENRALSIGAGPGRADQFDIDF
jgi:hypothetical protein